jgi:FkbM family methyltransferase
MDPRYLGHHLRIAREIAPAPRYFWRELVQRKSVLGTYQIRETNQTLHFRHRSPDMGTLTEVLIHRNYDFPASIGEVMRTIDPPLTVVDLGANIGLFGLRILAQRPDAWIVSVEPDPENAAVLRATVDASGCRSWSVIEACASTADGFLPFKRGDYLGSRVSEAGDPVRAIDVFRHLAAADLIKIDIEGSERALLEDDRFATLPASAIYLEYHPPHSRELVTDLLASAGYTIEPFEERGPGLGELWAWRSPP